MRHFDRPSTAGEFLHAFAENEVNLEYITGSSTADSFAAMPFCVNSKMAAKVDKILQANPDLADELNIRIETQVSMIGIYGPYFKKKTRLAAGFCQPPGKVLVNILGLSSTIPSICAVIHNDDLEKVPDTIPEVFELL